MRRGNFELGSGRPRGTPCRASWVRFAEGPKSDDRLSSLARRRALLGHARAAEGVDHGTTCGGLPDEAGRTWGRRGAPCG